MNKYYNKLIEREYNYLKEDIKPLKKVNHLNNIIRIKKSLYFGIEYEKNVYQDIKKWLIEYINSIDNSSYGYDLFCRKTVKSILSNVSNDKQIILYTFLIRLLKINCHINNEIIWCETQIKRIELNELWSSPNIFNFYKIFFLISSYNIYSLFVSLLLLLVCINILFLPETYIGLKLFTITYENYYTDNFILNHIVNINNYLFNFSNGNFKIESPDLISLLILVSIKLIFYVIIINFIIKEISRKVNKYD